MTRQNAIHKFVCDWEQEHKKILKEMQRKGYKRNHRYKFTRKWWRAWHKTHAKDWKLEEVKND